MLRRAFFIITILTIVTLLSQGGNIDNGRASSFAVLEGIFITQWGDGAERTGISKEVYFLADSQAGAIQLFVDDGILSSSGGVTNLNRHRVIVSGSWRLENQAINVQSLALVRGENAGTEGIYGPQPWVSILCKFSDVPAEPYNLPYFQQMYSSQYPGLDHFWREQSYNLANVEGSGAFGWYVLPHERGYYLLGGSLDFEKAAHDCTAIADANVYFPTYVGINLMFNDNLDCCAWGGSWYLCLDGECRTWRMTWEPPWGYQNIGVIGHETGHGFGLPHSYWNPAVVYDNMWDVMSDVWSNGVRGAFDPKYGTMGQHTISYYKDMLGWIDPGQVAVINSGETKTLTLERLALPQTGNYREAKVLVDDQPDHFLTVEARQLVGYDFKLPPVRYGLPGAVVLHDIHVSDPMPARVIDVDRNGDTGDPASMWLPGETYITPTLGIEMSVLSATDTGFVVKINNHFTDMDGIDIAGPSEGEVSHPVPFTATVSPADATTPISYLWEATGLPPVQHNGVNNVVDTVDFTWDEPGTKAITVTASNNGGSVVDTRVINIDSKVPFVSIEGPEFGAVNSETGFTATVIPVDVTLPISYTWQATDQATITNTGGISNSVSYAWDTPGTQAITVTASNVYGSTTDHFIIPILVPPTSLEVNGPPIGSLGNTYTFTAKVFPDTASTLIDYLWYIDGQLVFTHKSGPVDSVTFSWVIPGPHQIMVVASNPVGSVSGIRSMLIYYRVYLPTNLRN